jgi:hypothetical protein
MITLFMFKMSKVQEDITSASDKLLPLSESLVHIEAYLDRICKSVLHEAYAELPAFLPLAFAGCMDDSFMDAARVTHSFLRAHGGWLRQRFPNLPLDPQRRYGRKYFFCAHGLDVTASGASAGAALTGEDAMHAHVPYVQRATDSRWNLCRLKGLSERQVAASFDLLDGLPVSVLICVNTVNFARLLLLRQCAEHIYVTGQATISGKGFRSHSSIHTDERHYGCILRGDHQLTILPLYVDCGRQVPSCLW